MMGRLRCHDHVIIEDDDRPTSDGKKGEGRTKTESGGFHRCSTKNELVGSSKRNTKRTTNAWLMIILSLLCCYQSFVFHAPRPSMGEK
jgi:hypothetical protein